MACRGHTQLSNQVASCAPGPPAFRTSRGSVSWIGVRFPLDGADIHGHPPHRPGAGVPSGSRPRETALPSSTRPSTSDPTEAAHGPAAALDAIGSSPHTAPAATARTTCRGVITMPLPSASGSVRQHQGSGDLQAHRQGRRLLVPRHRLQRFLGKGRRGCDWRSRGPAGACTPATSCSRRRSRCFGYGRSSRTSRRCRT